MSMCERVLLITSSFEEVTLITAGKDSAGEKTSKNSHYPIGLAYLHAYLESCDLEVESVCRNYLSECDCFKEIADAVKRFSPTIIGFQILSANRVSSYRLIEHIHTYYPDVKIILGGIHATIMYEQLLERYPYVIIVRGEAEETFRALILSLRDNIERLAHIEGIAYCDENGSIITTPDRVLIDDLDRLPFPKHELFFDGDRRIGGIVTSRGCPFKCTFCALDTISRGRVRYRSITNVVEEVEHMVRTFPQLTEIWIHDDNFFLDNKRVEDFCDEIVRRNINVNFVCSARVKPLAEKLVPKLEKAGFIRVLFGLESGAERVLEMCKKGITTDDVVRAFQLFKSSSIELYAFLIVGLVGETRKTILETARFIRKLQRIKYVYYSNVAVLSVYPGTEIYEIAKAKGTIDDSFWLSDEPIPLFEAENTASRLFYYKEMLMNRISIDKLNTLAGLVCQLKMLPYILKYSFLRMENRVLLPDWMRKVFSKRNCDLIAKKYNKICNWFRVKNVYE